MNFKIPDVLEIERPKTSWTAKPAIDDIEEKKKLFGIELAKKPPFEAACNIFQDTGIALWVVSNLLNDPVVRASKDKYLEAVDSSASSLDKEQLAAKVLKFADEKNASNTFYLADAGDRLKALELYAKLKNYLNPKDNSNFSFTHNSMTIKLVEPEKKISELPKIINNNEDQNLNNNITPLKLKLVG